MPQMDEDTPGELSDSRHHQANERTLLAWLRTGIALMGLGLVAAKLVLADRPSWRPAAIGASLIVVGVLVSLFATLRFTAVRRALLQRRPYRQHLSLTLVLALLLTIIGAFMLVDVLATLRA